MSIRNNNKRLLVNTITLYGRMALSMAVSFFTTRVVLRVLGVEDFGLQNVIGGIAAMFMFVGFSLSTACSRFFSYEIGRDNSVALNHVFSMMLFLYLLGGVILLIFLETGGLWYLHEKLVCSEDRSFAAAVFYQMTILTVLANWFSVPYSSIIVSYENMALYSILSIADIVFKLLAALGVAFVSSLDHLIVYGAFLATFAVLHTLIYVLVAHMKYPVVKWHWWFEKEKFVEIFKFSGWQAYGGIAWTISDCFVGLLLNSFFGPAVNAARAVAVQVSNAMQQFSQNFLTATRPQIIKYWAVGERKNFYVLLVRSSKLACFLTFIVSFPMYVEANAILGWWLQNVPENTVDFLRIVLLTVTINSFSFPFIYAAQATGRIEKITLFGTGVLMLVWPVSWWALKNGAAALVIFWVSLGATVLAVMIRFYIVMRLTRFSCADFARRVFVRMLMVALLSILFVLPVVRILDEGVLRFVVVCCGGAVSSCLAFYLFGLEKLERDVIWAMVMKNFRSIKGVRV